eukprot:jgi/Ulvmu1/10928/UM007_0107.1
MESHCFSGRVLHGTCGWSDASIVSCGRFYPRSVKTSADKLAVHCRTFGCVEVDSSCYSIPSPSHVSKWVDSVPTEYKFHFKAFGLFCSQRCATNMLPRSVRSAHHSESISLSEMDTDSIDSLWQAFHGCLRPAKEKGQLGCVLFQFHLSFTPSDANKNHVEWCRSQLDSGIEMAVEFRAREWFHPDATDTVKWLTGLGIPLVAADELRHETFQPDRAQTGLPPGAQRELMPIALHVTNPKFFYIRLHRRAGTRDRIVAKEEHAAWAARLRALHPRLRGPVYFLWGTDWEDAPVVNAGRLQEWLAPELAFDWPAFARGRASGGRRSIAALLSSRDAVAKTTTPTRPTAARGEAEPSTTAPRSNSQQPGAMGSVAATAAAATVPAPPGTTWGPAAKARAVLAADTAGGSSRITGAANIAQTFAARAQVIAPELLPVRAPEVATERVCGAMDAFVTRSTGQAAATPEAAAQPKNNNAGPGAAQDVPRRSMPEYHKSGAPARPAASAAASRPNAGPGKRKRPNGKSTEAGGQGQGKLKQAGIQGFMQTGCG